MKCLFRLTLLVSLFLLPLSGSLQAGLSREIYFGVSRWMRTPDCRNVFARTTIAVPICTRFSSEPSQSSKYRYDVPVASTTSLVPIVTSAEYLGMLYDETAMVTVQAQWTPGFERPPPRLDSTVASKSGIGANKLAGDSMRDVIASQEAPALTEVRIRTLGGPRHIDVLKLGDELVSIESKIGRTSLGPRGGRIRQELARDWWSQRRASGLPGGATKVDRVRWQFTRSKITGEIGPTKPLQEKLRELGFEEVIGE